MLIDDQIIARAFRSRLISRRHRMFKGPGGLEPEEATYSDQLEVNGDVIGRSRAWNHNTIFYGQK
jgi:hypothetical protein